MKIILPDGSKQELNNELPYEEKKEIVDEILTQWNWYFGTYKNRKTTVCLEVLSNYLCYEKKEKKQKQGGETSG